MDFAHIIKRTAQSLIQNNREYRNVRIAIYLIAKMGK